LESPVIREPRARKADAAAGLATALALLMKAR
jgi:hypothetical protein